MTDFEKNLVKRVEMQDPQPDRIGFLPDHPVENVNKPGKVYRVANAASEICRKLLNSNFLTGAGVLMRFGENPVAVFADIEGIFMPIAILQNDRSALQFLWIAEIEIQQDQFTKLIFGAKRLPSCAIYVLNPSANRTVNISPKPSKPSESTFTWMTTSNHKQPKNTPVRQILKQHIVPKQVISEILGVKCNLQKDCFLIKHLTGVPKDASAYTQRKYVSLVFSIFDTIGIMWPSKICFKIVPQELWKVGKIGRTNCPASC